MKRRDMSGTVRCTECGASVEHERGPGSPLFIRHGPHCPELRYATRANAPTIRCLSCGHQWRDDLDCECTCVVGQDLEYEDWVEVES